MREHRWIHRRNVTQHMLHAVAENNINLYLLFIVWESVFYLRLSLIF